MPHATTANGNKRKRITDGMDDFDLEDALREESPRRWPTDNAGVVPSYLQPFELERMADELEGNGWLDDIEGIIQLSSHTTRRKSVEEWINRCKSTLPSYMFNTYTMPKWLRWVNFGPHRDGDRNISREFETPATRDICRLVPAAKCGTPFSYADGEEAGARFLSRGSHGEAPASGNHLTDYVTLVERLEMNNTIQLPWLERMHMFYRALGGYRGETREQKLRWHDISSFLWYYRLATWVHNVPDERVHLHERGSPENTIFKWFRFMGFTGFGPKDHYREDPATFWRDIVRKSNNYSTYLDQTLVATWDEILRRREAYPSLGITLVDSGRSSIALGNWAARPMIKPPGYNMQTPTDLDQDFDSQLFFGTRKSKSTSPPKLKKAKAAKALKLKKAKAAKALKLKLKKAKDAKALKLKLKKAKAAKALKLKKAKAAKALKLKLTKAKAATALKLKLKLKKAKAAKALKLKKASSK